MLLEKKKLLVKFKIQEEILWIKFAENIERSKGLTMKSALNKMDKNGFWASGKY